MAEVPFLERDLGLAEVSLRLTVAALSQGGRDPTTRMGAGGWYRAMRTPEGPATLRLSKREGRVVATAWGEGAAWAISQAWSIAGGSDSSAHEFAQLAAQHPVVADLARRMPGLRIPRTARVLETLIPTIISQKVTGMEAKRAWYGLMRDRCPPPPGPAELLSPGMRLPLDPADVAGLPGWHLHRYGLERKRAETLTRACRVAPRLEECAAMGLPDAYRRLQAVPGIGAWSAAEVALAALGDPDAVSVGDYHIPDQVAFALIGEPRSDDATMLELLAPFAGHRGRVIRLIAHGGPAPPRWGPRFPGGAIETL